MTPTKTPTRLSANTIASPPQSYQYRESFLLLGSALSPAPPERPDFLRDRFLATGVELNPEQWLFYLMSKQELKNVQS